MQIKNSLAMKMVQISSRGKFACLGFCFLVIGLELYVVYYSYHGRFLSSNIVTYSAAIGLFVNSLLVILGIRTYYIVMVSVKSVEKSVRSTHVGSSASMNEEVAKSPKNAKVAPAAPSSTVSSPQPKGTDAFLLRINSKCIAGSNVLLATSASIMLFMSFMVLTGFNDIVYSSPTMMAFVFLGFQLSELLTAYLELVLIGISIEPVLKK